MRIDRHDARYFTPEELDFIELRSALRNLTSDVADLERILQDDQPSRDEDARAAMRDFVRDAQDNLTRLTTALTRDPEGLAR